MPSTPWRASCIGPGPLLWLLSCTPTELPLDPPTPLASTAAGVIEGTVQDASGAPIPAAAVTTIPGGMEGVTDADGWFTLSRVLPDTYSLVVSAEGFTTARSESVTVLPDAIASLSVILSPAEALDGWLQVGVLGPDGAPWQAEVTLSGDDAQTQSTDGDGMAVFEGLAGQSIVVTVTDPTGRLSGESRTLTMPALGGETLAFRLAGLPSEGVAEVGSTYCGYCHGDIRLQHAASAHGQGLTDVDAVSWESVFEADGLIGGPLRGAVPYLDDTPLPLAWIPDHPERGAWSGGVGGEIDWTPPPEGSDEAACFSCHTSALNGGEESGVSCEACHGSGREHAYATSDRSLSITNPRWLSATDANAICASCHSAASLSTWPVGAAAVANAQSDELAASGHGTGDWAARCTDCHDPHSGALRLPETDNTLCLSCHAGLDFADESAIKQHTGHPVYQPEERPGAGRCTGCHMPETAARLLWRDETGAGDLASHRFLAISPQATLDDFDSAGVDTLSAGDFTPNACASCHAWNEWLFDGWFPGPSGAPTDRATHEALLEAYEEIWP